MDQTDQKIARVLLRDFSTHSATSLARGINMSRWGVWKILKKMEKEELITLEQRGIGKTSLQTVKLNWDNGLIEKLLSFSLTQEALKYQRWRHDFTDLEKEVDFLILYGSILHSPKEAKDIDILGVVSKEKNLAKISETILKIQEIQTKKIHAIDLTTKEFKEELERKNKAYLDALKKGIVLFGQDSFVRFIKKLQK